MASDLARTVSASVSFDVKAVEQICRMRGGSQSHLMQCSDGNRYVIKFQNNPQGRKILFNEFLGTCLMKLLGLPTSIAFDKVATAFFG